VAVLQGDPFNMKAVGVPFTFRVKHQDGFILKPHWDPIPATRRTPLTEAEHKR